MNALLHGAAVPQSWGQRETWSHQPCCHARLADPSSQQALQVVSEVVDVWFAILLTRSGFRRGCKHRRHSAPAFTERCSFGKEQQQGLPQLAGWVHTGIGRTFKHRRLCIGCEHWSGALQPSRGHLNCNWGPAGLRRRRYKLLVSQPRVTPLPEGPRMAWKCNSSRSQTPHPFFFRDSRAAARSQLCSLQDSSQNSVATTGLTRLVRGLEGERVREKGSVGSLLL